MIFPPYRGRFFRIFHFRLDLFSVDVFSVDLFSVDLFSYIQSHTLISNASWLRSTNF